MYKVEWIKHVIRKNSRRKIKKLDLSLDKKIGNAEEHNNRVVNISKQYIIKDTNRKFNNIDIISTTDNKIQGTTTITTDSNRNNMSPNEGMSKAKFLCEIKIMKSKSELTNTTNYIAKDIVVSNTIKNESVRTYKDIGKHPHAVATCQIYKECETSIPEPNNVNQEERTRLNEVRATSENTSYSKLDLVEYINECSK